MGPTSGRQRKWGFKPGRADPIKRQPCYLHQPTYTKSVKFLNKIEKQIKGQKNRVYRLPPRMPTCARKPPQLYQEHEPMSLMLEARPPFLHCPNRILLFSWSVAVAAVESVTPSPQTRTDPANMTTTNAATQHSQQYQTWNLVESGSLKALAKIKFSTEDRKFTTKKWV